MPTIRYACSKICRVDVRGFSCLKKFDNIGIDGDSFCVEKDSVAKAVYLYPSQGNCNIARPKKQWSDF